VNTGSVYQASNSEVRRGVAVAGGRSCKVGAWDANQFNMEWKKNQFAGRKVVGQATVLAD